LRAAAYLDRLVSVTQTIRRARSASVLLLCVCALLTLFVGRPAFAAKIQACFSPPLPDGCDPLATVVQAIDGARKTVLVQMYALTSREIVTALVNAKRRGIEVRVIVDRSQREEDRSDAYAVGRLAAGGIPVLVDTVPGLMHNKVMIVDDGTVATGSFNYTWSAEHKNAENLVLIHDPALAAEYTQNWNDRAAKSLPLNGSASAESPQPQTAVADAGNVPKGPVRGNLRSMIYQWPGCPYYDAISASHREEFPNAQAAKAAGFRPAKNCP
jgi:phosphatidylserine/phosphatidylglycerophosphate/cardiolipin synthase-like enzyme